MLDLVRVKVKPLVSSWVRVVGFFIFGLLLPTQLGKHFWFSFSYINGILVDYLAPTIYLSSIILLFLVIYQIVNSKYQILKSKIEFIIPILLFLTFNFIISNNGLLWFYRLWQYTQIGLAIFVFPHVTDQQKRWFFYGLVCASVYSLALAVSQILNQGSLQGLWWFLGERFFSITGPDISTISIQGIKILRPYATFSHPNSLAGFFLVVYTLVSSLSIPLVPLFSLLIILLSFSRNTIVILALFIFTRALLKSKKCTVCLVAQSIFCLWLVIFTFMWKGAPFSISDRVADWNMSFTSLQTMLFGNGLGNYLIPSSFRFTPQPVHNIYLLFVYEWGSVVVLILLWKFKDLLKYLLVPSVLVILLTGLFDHYSLTLIQNQLLLGVVGGLTLGSIPILKKKS